MKQVTLISNICFEPYWRDYVKDRFFYSYNNLNINLVLYEEVQDNAVCLNFDELYPITINGISSGNVIYKDIEKDCICKCEALHSFIKAYSNAYIIWFGFEDYYCMQSGYCGAIVPFNGLVDQINLVLNNILKDDSFVDFKRLIAAVGMGEAYDIKRKYRWNAPYSKKLIELMADEVYKQYLIYIGKTKKCIVLDCDNVLWGGILSEDGIEGIYLGSSGLGREYQDFQRFLLNLYYHGVILTVCSKNDEDDVMRVFREHSGMLLREEHIACLKVNWNDKPMNIKAIADELNIGTDSMVFVDDSIFEIEAVKSVLPDVTVIPYDRELMYDKFSCFNLKSEVNLPDVEKRNETYRTNRFRRELKSQCYSYDEYIKSLDGKVEIHKILPTEYSRVAELTQRTNKCTNGKRYTVPEIKERVKILEVHFYSVTVSDRFSDLGIVGAIEIENNELKLFNLSCRALGRKVEHEMINYISDRYDLKNIAFKLTEKNGSLLELMQQAFSNSEIISL